MKIKYFSLILLTSSLFALPEQKEVAAGTADFQRSDHSLQITTSDKAIVNYESFNIGKGEHVQFVQPSSKSCVLNRVVGKDGSKILGRLSGNGRIFLVNPQGIYFGKDAVVNTGSFLASTLNIRDEDFLKGSFKFYREPGTERSSIINEGTISASPEGFIALFAPVIEDRGSILAQAGKIILSSEEKVTIDFSGDGLIKFSVDGDLKQAIIEKFSATNIESGAIELNLRTAKDAIRMVVNTDGISPATAIDESNGIIRLVNSHLAAKHVHIEGSRVETQGTIDVSNTKTGEKGGSVSILGDHLSLKSTHIDASGDAGGGTVLIGGDYKGEGENRRALTTSMDKASTIQVDAYRVGDGGKAILWADGATFFEGKISARGGDGGAGGKVESSGILGLHGKNRYVNTFAPQGRFGEWLLDPATVNIATGGGATLAQVTAPNCGTSGTFTIDPATFTGSATNVAICSQLNTSSTINVNNAIVMTTPGVGLTLTAGSGSNGTITFNNGTITTQGGNIILNGVVALAAATVLDTTNAGGVPAGASITILRTVNNAQTLTLNGGTGGTVTMTGAVGGITRLTSLTATGATVTQSSTARTTGAFSYTGSTAINIGGNITTSGGVVTITGPATISANTTIDTTNGGGTPAGANLSFSSTINGSGSRTLTLRGGTGGVVSFGAVGGTTALSSLTVTGPTINQNSTAKTTGAISYTGTSAINVNGNITTSGGTIGMTGPVTITGSPLFDSTNAGGTPAGASISFSNTLNGATALTLRAGTGGTVSFANTVGNTAPLTNLSFTSANLIQVGNNITVSGANPLIFSSPVSLTGNSNITSNNANISFNSTLNGARDLTLTAGAGIVSFNGAVGGIAPLTNLTFASASLIQIGNNITVSGANPLVFPNPVSLTGTSNITSNNANITFNSTLNGAQALTLTAGTGSITLTGAVGGTTPLTSLTIASANNVTANAITAGAITQSAGTGTTTFNGLINTSAVGGIHLTGTNFALNANVTTTGGGPLSITHSGTLTIPVGVVLSISGGFTDAGTGSTSLTGNITTNGTDIIFGTPVTLGGPVSLSTGVGVGNIVFGSTLNGAQNLTLAAGGGNITMTGAVGGITRLGTLQINTVNNFTANGIRATVFNQASGTGTSTFNGAVDLTGGAGLSIIGNNVTFNNTVNTTSGGPVSVQENGTLVLTSNAVFTIDGAFTQTGTGAVQSAGSITTTNDAIQFAGPTVLTGLTTLNSTGANILFSSTLDGPGGLAMTAGAGNINLTGAVGNSTRIGALTINSATNITSNTIKASSINQVASSGTSSYLDINTSGAAGVQLTGNVVTINGVLATTGGGSFTVTNSGLLTLTAGGATSIDANFVQNGLGNVTMSGTIVANTGNISFATPVTLAGPVILNNGTGAGGITFSSTVNGAQPLTLTCGSGGITLGGAVGNSTPLTSLTFANAHNATTQAVTAGFIQQLSGSGTTTFNGALSTSNIAGINLTGTNFTFNNNTTTAAAGPLLVTNSGALTFSAGTISNIAGAFTQAGTGTFSIAGQITAGGDINVTGATTVAGTAQLSTAAASKNITLASTVDGGGSLTLAAGGGNISIQGAIGSTARLGALTIGSGVDVSTLGITAASIAQLGGTGTTTITGNLNTNGAAGIAFTLFNLSHTGTITTTNTGSMTVTNGGLWTEVAGSATSIDGTFLQNGAGSNNFSGTILTNNNTINFATPITLSGDAFFNTGSPGAGITLSGTVNGAHALTLTAGTGNILLSSAIGGTTPLSSLTFASANNITTQAITAGSLTQTTATGTSIFNGALSTSTAAGISLNGTAFQFSAPVTTTTTGSFAVTNTGSLTIPVGAPFNLSGGFTQTGAGAVSLGANITTNNAIAFAAPVTATAGIVLNSSAGGGNVTLSNTLNGAQAVTMTAGAGSISINGTTGAASALSTLTLSGNNISLGNIGGVAPGITGLATFTALQALNFNGTTYNVNSTSMTATTFNGNAGALTTFTTNTQPISFAGTTFQLAAGTNLTVNSSGGTIFISSHLRAPSGSLRTVTLNAGAATAQIDAVGVAGTNEFATVSVTGTNVTLGDAIFANTLSVNATGTIFAGGDITTTTPLLFSSPVVLIVTNTFSTGSPGANITFSSTLDGDAPDTRGLTLDSGSGSITFSGAVGGTNRLSSLTFSNALNVSAQAISADGVFQLAGTGTTTFNQPVFVPSVVGIQLSGNNFTINNTVTTASGGSLVVANTGTFTFAGTASLSGAFTQGGAGTTILSGSITAGQPVFFNGPVTLSGTPTITTSAANQNITFQSAVDGVSDGVGDLTLAAGTGNISFLSNIGSNTRMGAFLITTAQNVTLQAITAKSATLTAGTGTITANGDINTNGAAGVSVTGNNFIGNGNVTITNGGSITITNSGTITGSGGTVSDVDGSWTQNGTGPVFLGGLIRTHTGSFSVLSPTTLFIPTTIDTSLGGGNITFSSTVDGGTNLTLAAGAGNIQFTGAVGSISSLNALAINSAANVTSTSISAASIAQLGGTGTTTLNGALSTTGALGISIKTSAITRGAAITTTNGGPVTITNAGLFTSTAAGNISVSGAFTQNGPVTGTVTIGGSVTTANNPISFSNPITLAADTTFNTGTGAGGITLSQTIDGAFALSLNAGNGNITLSSAIGGSTRLTNFTIGSANTVSAQGIRASSIAQLNGSGTSTFNGALDTNGGSGISVKGTGFIFNNTFTTTAGGNFTVDNSGQATFNAGAVGTVAGSFSQIGTGGVQLSSAISSTGAMQFFGPATLGGTASLTTSANPITFSNILDGPGNLTLTATGANILLTQNTGAISRLGSLTVAGAVNFTAQAITAGSITQSAGTGTTLFNGDLNTNGSGGINLTGSAFTFLGNATTTNTGAIQIANGSLLTTTAGKTISSDGIFNQSGGGNVNLAGTVVTNDQTLTFTSPAITLTATTALSTGAVGAGDIVVQGTVDGPFPLTLTAGTGDIHLNSNIGGITRLGFFTITNAKDIFAKAITASAMAQLAGTGTSTLTGSFDTNTPQGITLIGNNFTTNGVITTTNGGPLTVTNTGLITATGLSNINLDGAFTQNGTGPVNIGGTITTTNDNISHSGPITILAPAVFTSSGGNITFTNTVNGAQNFTLNAGSGNISFSAAVGGLTPIGNFSITSANNLTTAAFSAASVSAPSLSGAAAFNGTLTTSNATGISLSGASFTFNNVTTTGTGGMAVANTGLLTLSNGSVLNLDGPFAQTSTGAVSYGASMTTTNDAVSFASPVTLTAVSSVNTGAGAGDITFSQTVNGAFGLTLAAGTGNVNLQGAVGNTAPPTALTISSATNVTASSQLLINGPFTITSALGTSTFNGAVTSTATGINLSSVNITFNSPVTTTNNGTISLTHSGLLTVAAASPIISSSTFTEAIGGTVSLGSNVSTTGTLQFGSPITLTNPITLNSGGGSLMLSNTVNGAQNLTLIAGSGSIALGGAVGGVTPLLDLQFTSGSGITAAAISSASIKQVQGTGLTHFSGALSTTTISGISLTGNQFTFDQTVNTTGSGPLTISHTGLLTLNAAAVMNLTGLFSETGGGNVSTAANITTTNQSISWSDPITLTGDVTLDTGAGAGDITFSNTINGPFCLTLNAGTGIIQFSSPVGAISALNCLTASGSTIFQNSSIQTVGAVQETGAIQLGGNITTNNSAITLNGNVLCTESSTLSTSAGAGNISITGTFNPISPGHSLSLLTTTGDVTIGGVIGSTIPFNNLTMTGNNISWNNLGSTTPGATGTTSLNAAADMNFTGTSYAGGTQSYTAGTSFVFNSAGTNTVTSNNSPITFTTGTIQLGAAADLSIAANGGNVSINKLEGLARNLTIDANALTYVQIGTAPNPLNVVTITANTSTPTPPTNIFATTVNFTSVTPTTISTNQTIVNTTFNVPVIIQGNITYSCGGGGTITFNQRVDANTPGVDTLTFNFSPCTGSLVFNGPVGGVAPLASLTVDSATNVSVNSSMTIGSFTETNGTGTTTLAAGITSTAAGGVQIATNNISLSGAITTASGGSLTLNNSGTLTSNAGMNLSGAFQQTGAGAATMQGSITTNDAIIQFTGPVTLNGDTDLNSNGASAGDISFASTIDGNFDLTLSSGARDITLTGAVGGTTPLDFVTINNARNVTATAISATAIIQSAGTGTTLFNGVLNTTGASGINLIGAAFTINNSATTAGSGPIIVTNAGLLTLTASANCSVGGAFTQNGAGSSSLAGQIASGGVISFATPVTLSAATLLNTSTNSSNIIFSSTLNGPGALTLNLGAGDLTFGANVGSLSRLGALSITNVDDFTAQSITAASIAQVAGTGLTTLANLNTNGGAGISLVGTQFSINGNLITTNTGSCTINNSGPLSLTGGASSSIDGAFAQTGAGAVLLSGTILTNNNSLSFASGVTLAGITSLSTGTGTGTITFSSTLDGAQNLTLAADGGNIVFGGNIGGIDPLGVLTVNSVNNITYPFTKAAALAQLGSTGTTTITGPVTTTTAGGVSIVGGVVNQNGNITATNGPFSVQNSGTFTVTGGVTTTTGGTYTQFGGGAVVLNESVIATNSTISFAGATTLTGPLVLNSGPVGGNIIFTSTIDGAQDITMTAVGGSITLGSAIGGITRVGNFVIDSALNVTTQGIIAASITQANGTGLTTFNGPLNTNTLAGISLKGAAFTLNNTFTTTAAGTFTVDTTGLATFNAGATGSVAGAFTLLGTGSMQLSSTITAGGSMQFNRPLSAVGTGSLSTAAANQPITFLSTVEGPGNLTLASGTGDITFQRDAGASSRLGALTITSAQNLTTQGVIASSITESGVLGTTLFNGDLNTNGGGGINLSGIAITFLGNATATNTGAIAITNNGLLTTNAGKTLSADGSFTETGAGNVSLAGTVSTNNAALSFAQPITLTAPATLTTGSGGPGTITLSSTVDGAFPMTLTAGTGDIHLNGVLGGGTRLGFFTITSANDIFAQAITASAMAQLAGAGTSHLAGSFDTNTPQGITLVGNNFITNGVITTTNGGPLTVTNTGLITATGLSNINLDGAFTQNGSGPVNIGGTITTTNDNISHSGPITALAPAVFTSNGGDIIFTNTINGAQSLTLTAGSGNVSLSQTLGGSSALTAINFTGKDISLGNIGGLAAGVSGLTSITATEDVIFTGTTYNANTQTYTAPATFNFQAGAPTTFSTAGNPLTFNNGTLRLSATTNVTMNTTGGNITAGDIHSTASSLRSLTMNAGAGSIQVGIIGSSGNNEFASVSFTCNNLTLNNDLFSNAVTMNATGTIFSLGDITSASSLSFPVPVVLQATNTFSTNGNISFSSTIDGDVADARALTLSAGTGSITFTGAVGGTQRLSGLTIASANNVTAAAISTDGLFQFSGTGTTIFNGPIFVPSVVGIQLGGNNFTFNSTVTTLSNAPLLIGNAGTLTFAGTANISGGFTQGGAGPAALSGSITAGQPILFNGPVTLSGTSTLSTAAANQDITFVSTVDGAGDLTLASGSGSITFLSDVGSNARIGAFLITSAQNVTVQALITKSIQLTAGSGLITANGQLNTNSAAGINVVGNNFQDNAGVLTTNGGSLTVTNSGLLSGINPAAVQVDNSFIQNGTGPVFLAGSIAAITGNISFQSPLTLFTFQAFDTSAGGGNIIFNNTVDGTSDVVLAAGAGNIQFNFDAGLITALNNVTISSAANVTTQAIKAASITQVTGTGTTDFTGDVTTTGIGGLSISTDAIVRGGNITTLAGGPIVINNSGLFTSTAAGTINSSGSFSQTGAGNVSFSGILNTTNSSIFFAGPVTLAGTSNFNSGAGSGSILFSNTVDGAQSLTLNSGLGDTTFSSGVGQTTRLGDITITTANNTNFGALKAASFTELSGNGLATFNGPTDTNTATGFNFTGNAITINNTLTTTLNGPVVINNSGLLTLAATCNLSNAFTQTNANGSSTLSGSITSAGSITFNGPASTSGSPFLTTSNQPILFSSTLNGPGNLTLNSGSGNTTCLGAAGSTSRLGALIFTNAGNISMKLITAASITQVTAGGTTTLTGGLNTSNLSGISLNGNIFNINGSIITTNLGPCSINHTGLLTLTVGPSTLISGPFTETGTAPVSLSGNLHASNANISFANPITLTAATTINSDGGGDILISNTMDGNVDLNLNSGTTGNITISAAMGGTTPINSVTINNAHDVTTQAISAGFITQLAGTGLTQFNGPLLTTTPSGIVLTGNNFTFINPVTTQMTGAVQISNAGLLSITATAPMTLDGSFSQLTTNPVSLCANITCPSGSSILFTGPVSLCSAVVLDTDDGSGNITFLNTLNGNQNLTLHAGNGTITLGSAGQTIPLGAFQVTGAENFISQSISSSSISLTNIVETATFNGSLSTTGPLGISLSGFAFNFNGNITTTNTGPLTITNSGAVAFSPTGVITLDGPFTMNGSGDITAGGTLTTNNQNVLLQSPVFLTGNFTIQTNGGNVTFASDLDGPFNLTINAGTGNISAQKIIGDGGALNNMIFTAHDISLNGIGTSLQGATGALNLTATNNINLNNVFYNTGSQNYSAGNAINFTAGAVTHLISSGQPITFATGPVQLSTATDLHIETNNGAFSFVSISGTSFENLDINTGTGPAFMNIIGPNINNVFVNAGSITFAGIINAVNTDFESLTTITNFAGPVAINSTNNATFNALGGNVGTTTNPILVNTSNKIFAGANGGPPSLADFNGSSSDNTVHNVPTNPPCIIIFNGITIQDCHFVPPAPSPSVPSAVVPFPFAVPGFDSSLFNLASDFFFFPDFIDETYLGEYGPMYYRASSH